MHIITHQLLITTPTRLLIATQPSSKSSRWFRTQPGSVWMVTHEHDPGWGELLDGKRQQVH